MRTLIQNGLLVDPANRVQAPLNLLVEDGTVAAVTRERPQADEVIDAAGMIVAPGFVDLHMHEDPVGGDGAIETSIFNFMLRMGVTTAVGGNCGMNEHEPGDYLDIVDRDGAPVNVALLAGQAYFRQKAGATDKYRPATPGQRREEARGLAESLDRGCLGVSYGIRYSPGIDQAELEETAAVCRKQDKLIAAHIRDDAEAVFGALKELLDAGRELGLPVEVSHIGSMAGFGQMARFLAMVDEYRMNGLRVDCDCYPYYAFSTHLGSTPYDDGWMDRYGCGYDVVELCEGKYKGRRCTKEIFDEVRRDHPDCITVCHVMKPGDVDLALGHPSVMLASDGILNRGQGHPRAAGAFPRLIAQFVRTGKLTLHEAVAMMTSMPAEKLELKRKGRLNAGADADIVVFDLEKIQDRATFSAPTLAPEGITHVLIGGRIAMKDGRVAEDRLGRSVRK
ncbi:MAG TPA: amidohydrolase family protein [Holophaga sp.]|nr:amidohydrolase family protein [Holophaga sp.]HPS68301.1 amidohydrolase family protein [Holophaga sp.]